MAALWFGHARAASGTCGLRMAVRSAPDVPPRSLRTAASELTRRRRVASETVLQRAWARSGTLAERAIP